MGSRHAAVKMGDVERANLNLPRAVFHLQPTAIVCFLAANMGASQSWATISFFLYNSYYALLPRTVRRQRQA